MTGQQIKTMVKRVESFEGSVDELVDWCAQRGLDPQLVTVTGTHLRFLSPQTDEEREQRAKWDERARQRTEAWERETYERLAAKFGGVQR